MSSGRPRHIREENLSAAHRRSGNFVQVPEVCPHNQRSGFLVAPFTFRRPVKSEAKSRNDAIFIGLTPLYAEPVTVS